MTEEWVKLWYQCLHGSDEYSFYHAARYKGDAEACAAIETRNGRIKEVYEDFGLTYFWPLMQPGTWEEWFAQRGHLFMHSAQIVDDLSTYQSRQGYVLLEVPLQADAKSTAALVHDLLAQQYDAGGVVPAPAPKYALNMKDGRPAAGFEQVRKACIAGREHSYKFDHEQFNKGWTAHSQLFAPNPKFDAGQRLFVEQFARHELDNMGWTLDPRARKQLDEEGTLSDRRFESFKSMLNRSRREFKLLAANAARGSFPDLTPGSSWEQTPDSNLSP